MSSVDKERIGSIYASDNYLWFFESIFHEFDEAKAACEAVGYSLPTASELSEFEEQIYTTLSTVEAPWGKDEFFKIENVHTVPKAETQTVMITLCKKERNLRN